MLDCSVCKKSYLHSCVDFSSSELRMIKANIKKGISWFCNDCKKMGNDINELKAAVLALKEEFLARERPVITESIFEELLSEMNDRNNRKQNIMLFNVAEAAASLTSDERKSDDRATAFSVLESLSVGADFGQIDIQRVGRFIPDAARHRPIKIRLNNVNDAHIVIKSAKKLKSSERFKNVRISLDKTKRQTEYYKKVKAELDARIANGENLKIKYQGGIPSIISLN